jgi:hypothetical protein
LDNGGEVESGVASRPLSGLNVTDCRYDRAIDEDRALIEDNDTPVRHKVACRLLVCEKEMLHDVLDDVVALPFAPKISNFALAVDGASKCVKLQ